MFLCTDVSLCGRPSANAAIHGDVSSPNSAKFVHSPGTSTIGKSYEGLVWSREARVVET